MNKKLLTLLIVLIALGSFGYFAWVAYTPLPITNTAINETPDENVEVTDNGAGVDETPIADETPVVTVTEVSYSDAGFTPGEITIKAGSSVRFVNNSQSLMWVASDNHPTHTEYADFDQKTAVPNGGVYTFKFNNVGTWGFHNHVKPSAGGTITVTE